MTSGGSIEDYVNVLLLHLLSYLVVLHLLDYILQLLYRTDKVGTFVASYFVHRTTSRNEAS